MLICGLTVTVLSGCGSTSDSVNFASMEDTCATEEAYYDDYSYDDYSYDELSVASESTGIDETQVTFAENKKIIYTSNVELETKDYNKTYTDLLGLVNKYGGYIESEKYYDNDASYLNNKQYTGKVIGANNTLVIRIPDNSYSAFMQEGLQLGNVLSRNQTVEDKTSTYNTNKSYVDILNDEADYLAKQLEVLEDELKTAKATDRYYDEIIVNMKDIAYRKAEVEKELVPYKTAMDAIDEKVEFSTITMTIKEVEEYSEVLDVEKSNDFGYRVKQAWNNATNTLVNLFQGTIIGLINCIPVIIVLLILGIVVLIIWFVVKKCVKSTKIRDFWQKRSAVNSESATDTENTTLSNISNDNTEIE